MSDIAMLEQLKIYRHFVAYSICDGVIFEPVPCSTDSCGWTRNLVGSVAREVRGVDSSNEAEDATSDAGWCGWSSGDISALVHEALVSEVSTCSRYFSLGIPAMVWLHFLQVLKSEI